MTTAAEKLGPAEKILQTLLNPTDHMVHNRPGMVTPDARHTGSVRWVPVTHKEENGQKIVYALTRVGKKTNKIRKGGRDGARAARTPGRDRPRLQPERGALKTDYWITVCSACRCASCWHGEFVCDRARGAATTQTLASVLSCEDREHPSNFSEDRLRAVCGTVRYVP